MSRSGPAALRASLPAEAYGLNVQPAVRARLLSGMPANGWGCGIRRRPGGANSAITATGSPRICLSHESGPGNGAPGSYLRASPKPTGAAPELSQKLGAATTESLRRTNIAQVESHVKQNRNLNPKKLSAVRSFYRMLLNSRKRLKTQGFKQVNHSFPLIRSHPILRASRELAREKSREDIGF